MCPRWISSCLLLMFGCVKPGDVPCGDRICPSQTICEPTTLTCLSEAQATACIDGAGIAEGETCSGLGFVGICTNRLCVPGCGDGEINRDSETCDDGNYRSHDGCSSRCTVETLTWEQMPDPWTGMFNHVAGYHPGSSPSIDPYNGFQIVLTGQSQTGLRTKQLLSRDATNWFDEKKPLPTMRTGAAMVLDKGRNKLVLFGGAGPTAMNDTWEWDYTSGWIERTDLTTKPPPRQGGQLAYDSTHQRVVLFGGLGAASDFLDDTWELDGTTWTPRNPSTRPLGRVQHSMTYDASRDRVVLYGGKYLLSTLSDHWEYDNGTWTAVTPATTPGTRSAAAMSYATDRGVVLFGGYTEANGGTFANDTWQYNGSNWSRISSTVNPPARTSATLYPAPPQEPFDHSSAPPMQLILLGGDQADGKPVLGDEWRLTPTGWVDITPHGLPPARQGAPAVYDDRTHAIHIFGGIGTSLRTDVWSYLDIGWATPPRDTFDPHYFHCAGYDPVRDRLVMFGGLQPGSPFITDETFETPADNAFAWTQRTFSTTPPSRVGCAMAWDGKTLVLFGGNVGGTRSDDTWTYDGTSWTQEPKSGAWPAASTQASAAYDYVHDRLVLFDHDGVTWTHSNHQWTKLVDASAIAPPARDDASMTFDWQTKRMILLGGRKSSTDLVTDVWELADTTWRELAVNGESPLPRALFGFASTPVTHEMLLIGGTATGAQPAGDVWELRYREQGAIDEDCMNEVDDDGDLRPDFKDPDCCALEVPSTCLER